MIINQTKSFGSRTLNKQFNVNCFNVNRYA